MLTVATLSSCTRWSVADSRDEPLVGPVESAPSRRHRSIFLHRESQRTAAMMAATLGGTDDNATDLKAALCRGHGHGYRMRAGPPQPAA